MIAARLQDASGPRGLRLETVPVPTPCPEQIRVRVRATALNRADLLQTLGLYPAPPGVPADIPGLEYAGEVDAVGEGVIHWKKGDRVMGLVAGGAFAEYLVTHSREALAMPRGMSFTDAAAIPEAFSTAFDALSSQAHARAGQWALVHACASGVGTAAVQWLKAEGLSVAGTSRTAAKLGRVEGLDAKIETTRDGWAEEVRRATGGAGANVVLDLVGGSLFPETLAACAPRATVMLVGLTAGPVSQTPLQVILGKRLTVIGTTLRARSTPEKIAVAEAVTARVLPLFDAGTLKPVVGSVRPFKELTAALQQMAANDTFGKTVLILE